MDLRDYIANTDFDWYTFFRRRQPLDEVNFWKPGSGAIRPVPGTPFLFKLKRPHFAIAGFGVFARYSRVPISMAWEMFREKNGAPDFVTLKRLIDAYHEEGGGGSRFDYEIGCVMVAGPVFFQEGYARRFAPAEAPLPPLFEGERFGTPQLVEPRLGQGTFRIAVADAYGRACAVTGEHTLPALEAAHIQRYSSGGAHRVSNGILLRADIHRLFDHGYVTITPDYVFRVSRRIEEVFKNGRSYQPFRDHPIHPPDHPGDRPDRLLLEEHNDAVFLR